MPNAKDRIMICKERRVSLLQIIQCNKKNEIFFRFVKNAYNFSNGCKLLQYVEILAPHFPVVNQILGKRWRF